MMKSYSLKIGVYQAITNSARAEEFFCSHINVLKNFGVTDITSISARWKANAGVWMITVEDDDTHQMVAGVRLDMAGPSASIPLQEALRQYPKVMKYTSAYVGDSKIAELCGLWVHADYRGLDLPNYLIRSAIAVAPSLGIKNIFGFANKYSQVTTSKLGFKTVTEVENSGIFHYPDERYESFLIELTTDNIASLADEDRTKIEELRQYPYTINCEYVKDHMLIINYDLYLEEPTPTLRIIQLYEDLYQSA